MGRAKKFENMTEEEIIEQRLKDCRKRREVNCCEECSHYRQCILKEPLKIDEKYPITEGEKALLMAIITSAVEDYAEAWKLGLKGKLISAESFLKSEKVALYSLGEFDGESILSNLQNRLYRQYGSFEGQREKTIAKYEPKLRKLEEKLKKAKGRKRANLLLRIKAIERMLN